RRRFYLAAAKWLFVAAALLAAGVYAYQTGSLLAQREVTSLKEELEEKAGTATMLQQRIAELEVALQETRQREAEWQERYSADVPTGEMKALLALARQKAKEGVEPDRLAFVMRATSDGRACRDDPVTKRFIVRTPTYSGRNDVIT